MQSHSRFPVPSTFTIFLPPLLQWSLSLGYRRCHGDVFVGAGHRRLHCSLHSDWLWFSVMAFICGKDGWSLMIPWLFWLKSQLFDWLLLMFCFILLLGDHKNWETTVEAETRRNWGPPHSSDIVVLLAWLVFLFLPLPHLSHYYSEGQRLAGHTVHVQRSEGTPVEVVSLRHFMGSGDGALASRLAQQVPLPVEPSHQGPIGVLIPVSVSANCSNLWLGSFWDT